MHETEEQREYLSAIYRSSTFDVGWLMEEYRGEDVIALHGEPEPYEGQDRIVRYLRYGGMPCMWRMSDGRAVERCDGDFTWFTDLADKVSRYNLRLEPEFERAVLDDPKRLVRFRRLLIEHHIHPGEL